MADLKELGRKRFHVDKPVRKLHVDIVGGYQSGKTALLWMLLQQAETFGATVSVQGEDSDDNVVRRLREHEFPFKPGFMRGLQIVVTTKTVEEPDDT